MCKLYIVIGEVSHGPAKICMGLAKVFDGVFLFQMDDECGVMSEGDGEVIKKSSIVMQMTMAPRGVALI